MHSCIDAKDKKEIEYEFLYNIRDQAMLYLRMSESNLGYAEKVLNMVNEMVENLAKEITGEE